jgi:WD40 repeat protein
MYLSLEVFGRVLTVCRATVGSPRLAKIKLGTICLALIVSPGYAASPSDSSGAPILVLQKGSLFVTTAFSPNNEFVATAGAGETVKLWDVQAGKLLRDLNDSTSLVTTLAFSSPEGWTTRFDDGKWLAAGNTDGQVIVWSMLDGRLLITLPKQSGGAPALVFSPNNRWLAVGSGEGEVRIIDTSRWELPARKLSCPGPVTALQFSGNNASLAAIVEEKQNNNAQGDSDAPVKTQVVVWNTATWQARPALKGPDNASKITFTPANQLLVSGFTTNDDDAKPDQMNIAGWNAADWGALQPPTISVKKFGSCTFSGDGQRMFVEDRGPEDFTGSRLRGWNTSNWQELPSVSRVVNVFFLLSRMCSNWDGKRLIMSDGRTGLEILDLERPNDSRSIPSLISEVTKVAFSHGGSLLASAFAGGTLRIWDLELGRLSRAVPVKDAKGVPAEISSLTFSPDDKLLIVTTGEPGSFLGNGIKLIDLATGTDSPLSSRLIHYDSIACSPDRRWMITGGASKLQLWKWLDGAPIAVDDWDSSFSGGLGGVQSIAFSLDSRWLAVGDADNQVHIWELVGEKWNAREENLVGPSGSFKITNLAFSPDKHHLVAGGNGPDRPSEGLRSGLKVWEIGTWTESPELSLRAFDTIAFDSDNRLMTAYRYSSAISQVDLKSGREAGPALIGHSGSVTGLAFDPLNRWLASSSHDGTLRLWDGRSKKPVLTLVTVGNDTYWGPNALVVTPDGLFDGTPESMRQANWRYDGDKDITNVFNMSLFFDSYYYPGLLREIFKGHNPAAPDLIAAQAGGVEALRRLLKQNLAHLDTRNGKPVVCFGDLPSVADLGIFVNGEQLRIDPANIWSAREDISCQFRAELPVTDKQVEIIRLMNKDQGQQREWNGPRSEVSGATLHVLTVGIKDYPVKSNYLTLPYSASDAREVEEFFEEQRSNPGKSFGNIRISHLYNEEATADFIRRKLAEMSREIKEGDTVFLYFSGHGAVPAGEAMFYFAPVDADSQRLNQTGFNSAMFAEALRNIKARRIVLVIDACQSGGVLESLGRIGEMKNTFELRNFNSAATNISATQPGVGVHIIASATPLQEAIQPVQLRKGVMAKVLLDALKEKPRSGDGKIWMRDIIDYINQHLTALSAQAAQGQSQRAMIQSIGLDFPLAVQSR